MLADVLVEFLIIYLNGLELDYDPEQVDMPIFVERDKRYSILKSSSIEFK